LFSSKLSTVRVLQNTSGSFWSMSTNLGSSSRPQL
jgi:hypothetical protein